MEKVKLTTLRVEIDTIEQTIRFKDRDESYHFQRVNSCSGETEYSQDFPSVGAAIGAYLDNQLLYTD